MSRWTWRNAGTQEMPRTELLRDGRPAGELTFMVRGVTPYPALLNDSICRLLDKGAAIYDEWDATDEANERRNELAEAE